MIRPVAKTKDTVTLARRDYDRLMEELGDRRLGAAALQAEAAIAAGESEDLPAAMVKRMMAGENLVRLWREHRGLSGKELVKAASMNAGYLSDIETGKKPGSIKTLDRLASALKVKVDDLIGLSEIPE